MTKKKTKSPKSENADKKNPNKGTNGTNIAWDKMNGHRGMQMDPKRNQSK
jgi:hypothetical protein